MATPVSIALIWQMMFHPQLGVLNYLLSLVGIPPQKWVFASTSVIPSQHFDLIGRRLGGFGCRLMILNRSRS